MAAASAEPVTERLNFMVRAPTRKSDADESEGVLGVERTLDNRKTTKLADMTSQATTDAIDQGC
jgi:hypothetical protein